MIENNQTKNLIADILHGEGHSGSVPFEIMVNNENITLCGIEKSDKNNLIIEKIILAIIEENKYNVGPKDIKTYRRYHTKDKPELLDGIKISFNNFDSDIKGELYIGFTKCEEDIYPVYIFNTHIDISYNDVYQYFKFAKNLREDIKKNKLKMNLQNRSEDLSRYGEHAYLDPIIYRTGKNFTIEEFMEFIKDINMIAKNYPLCHSKIE